jgi:hypothetical protein
MFMYYTPETLLNHVFEDLRKPKAPNNIYIYIYISVCVCVCLLVPIRLRFALRLDHDSFPSFEESKIKRGDQVI